MRGEADYKPSPGREDSLHLIGTAANPIWIGPKREVPNLFTPAFWYAYETWRMFNLGFGLPESGAWTAQDQWLMDTVSSFEEHYRKHFAPERYFAELILAGFKALAARG